MSGATVKGRRSRGFSIVPRSYSLDSGFLLRLKTSRGTARYATGTLCAAAVAEPAWLLGDATDAPGPGAKIMSDSFGERSGSLVFGNTVNETN